MKSEAKVVLYSQITNWYLNCAYPANPYCSRADLASKPFDEIKASIDAGLAGVLSAIIVVLSFIVLVIMKISHSIIGTLTKPVLQLLYLVKKVNRKSLDGDLPDLKGGSLEVTAIYEVFKKLYTVIRFANDAFFAGDPQKAKAVMERGRE